jgi:hypothetical protein
VERVKRALFDGGIQRANKPEGVRNTPGIQARAASCAALQATGACRMGQRRAQLCGVEAVRAQIDEGTTLHPPLPCPALQKWEDLELIYAGQRMADPRQLEDYHVPPVG